MLTPVRLSVVGLRWGKFLVCEDCEGPALMVQREGSEVNERHSAGHPFTLKHVGVAHGVFTACSVKVKRKQSRFYFRSLDFFFFKIKKF